MSSYRSPPARAAALLVLVGLLGAGGCASDGRDDPYAGVPETLPFPALAADCLAAGWWPVAPIRRYYDEARFDYLLADAEIYREYGLLRVEAQDYVNVEGDAVRVEVFQTETEAGAYGLFSLKTRPGGAVVAVGEGVGGWLEPAVLHFHRGSFQVTIRADRVQRARVHRVDQLAASVNQALRGGVERPALMERLPARSLLPAGEVYVAGPVSLRRALGTDGFPFPPPRRGVCGTYSAIGGEHTLVILEYDDPDAAVAAGLAAAPKGSDLNAAHTRLLVVLPLPNTPLLYAYIGPKDPARARRALADAEQVSAEKGG